MTRQPNVLTDTESAPFSGSDSGYSQGSIVVRFHFVNFKLEIILFLDIIKYTIFEWLNWRLFKWPNIKWITI